MPSSILDCWSRPRRSRQQQRLPQEVRLSRPPRRRGGPYGRPRAVHDARRVTECREVPHVGAVGHRLDGRFCSGDLSMRVGNGGDDWVTCRDFRRSELPAKPLYGGRVFLQPGICPGSIENGLHERALELGKVLPRYEAGAPFGRQPLGNGGWP